MSQNRLKKEIRKFRCTRRNQETKGLVNEIEQQKLQFIRHIMRYRCIENYLLAGMVFGKRSRGRQKTRMTNTIKETLGLTLSEANTTAQDREKWKNIVYTATAVGETVLNDGSSNTNIESLFYNLSQL